MSHNQCVQATVADMFIAHAEDCDKHKTGKESGKYGRRGDVDARAHTLFMSTRCKQTGGRSS